MEQSKTVDFFGLGQEGFPEIANYDRNCIRCLCHAATGCNLTLGCTGGYCGPFKISRIYWIDAGNVTLAGDDPERIGAYEDCALAYHCAINIVRKYLIKYGRNLVICDCNEDGVTNCDDFSMINFNGGNQCQPPLERNEYGLNWTRRYRACSPVF
ncbi:hypothetical protein NQ318_021797 [Aromia moschata]|uniref:lysozyme n=1 Tax=Aromia moschata TaxID=1265417 RepID=A0AAV8Z8K8_9CUCU|nr:hypothetical protein NQ318_021797 [Aromia moschata]